MSKSLDRVKKMLNNRLLSMKTDAKNRRRFTLYQQVEEIEVMIVMFEKELKNDRSGIKLDEE
jgi:hypothetical protein